MLKERELNVEKFVYQSPFLLGVIEDDKLLDGEGLAAWGTQK